MAIDLYLIDEVNVRFDGLTDSQTKHIIKATERSVPGAFQSAAFKLHKWNGKESNFSPSGYTFSFLLDQVLDILERDLLVDLDQDITLHDVRELPLVPDHVPRIDNTYLSGLGITMHDHQVEAVNRVIEARKGIIDIATTGGKTYICLSLSKVFSEWVGSVVVVPNKELLVQTYNSYVEEGSLNVAMLTGNGDREQIVANHDHIIVTWQLLKNSAELFRGFRGVLIQDECHILGEVMQRNLRDVFSDCPVRVGMTATVPKTGHKKEKLFCHIGGDVLIKVETRELQEHKIASTCSITTVRTRDSRLEHEEPFEEWESEKKYLLKNRRRVDALAEYLDLLPNKNTLVLTHPQFGSKIAKKLSLPFIDMDVKSEDRIAEYEKFEVSDDNCLIATFGTAGTGISINRIFRLILIDPGKNPTAIVQGIGRGLRLDGVYNHLEVFDIYSNTRWSVRHQRGRQQLYRSQGFELHTAPDIHIL